MAVVEERLDGIRLITGDLGGVTPLPPFRELRDVLLFNVGVNDSSIDPVELDVEVLWKGAGEVIFRRSAEIWDCTFETVGDCTGDEGGRAVKAAALDERRRMVAEIVSPIVFVDLNEGKEGAATLLELSSISSSFISNAPTAAASNRWQSTLQSPLVVRE